MISSFGPSPGAARSRNTKEDGFAESSEMDLLGEGTEHPAGRVLLGIAIFVLATGLAIFSQQFGRPVTAAIVYLFGVTVAGALHGMRGGLFVAVAASVIYNFFISDPVFRFSLTSAEELVPLLAFNVSAAASALVAGRLHERAVAAESANRRVTALLEVSRRLQSAAHVNQIPQAIAGFLARRGYIHPAVYLADSNGSLSADPPVIDRVQLAKHLLVSGDPSIERDQERAVLITKGSEPLGVLVVTRSGQAESDDQEQDLDGLLTLLAITLERCLLLEQVSEAELVRRSEEFKTSLLSSVSHDMRTPLSVISASASSVRRYGDELAASVRNDLLETIEEQCDRLNRYTTNLLNLVRLQFGVDAGQFTECEALDVLGAAISRARTIASGREISKHFAFQDALVRADPLMLEQVFYNVLENAVRYSPDVAPIRVAAWTGEDWLHVTITDCGIGIEPQDSDRVFDRFYRSSRATHQEGSGLGLSIAKGFTEAFGGTIRVASGAEGGTTVEICLPLQRTKREAR
ncbi:sensor histidine kinase [Allosphingosinicella deserti]|uniref:histidine kinase n=1 Tax=Allosphingosinicella deserti TaxID=2116704 RepID=A0A2P7QDW5_9SPHN|nr:ATP-binding protein [Sphingomonas deserti]PSJ36168.1 hypothetical protein C7I55_27540 [Sphingomonas deserti]